MRPVPVHRPSSAPPCRSSKSRRRAAARPCVRADVARVRASGPSPPRRCPAVDRPSPTDQARCSARRAARSNAGRTRSSPPPRRSNAPSPVARSSGNAAKTSRLRSPRTAPPTPPRSDDQQCKPCSPPRDSWPFHLPADNPHGNPHPVESISRKPYQSSASQMRRGARRGPGDRSDRRRSSHEAMLERGATPGREAIVRFPRRRWFRCARCA